MFNNLKIATNLTRIDNYEIQFGKNARYTKWEIREAEYQEEVLTDHFEMHIISLPEAIKEYDKNKDDKVLQWMMFLNDPGSVEVAEIMKKNKAIKEANKKLYEISQDEALRRQALNEEIARMDEEQRMYDATQKGLNQGKVEGRAEGKAEMIKQLASIKMDVEQIAKVANMTEEEVKKILDEEKQRVYNKVWRFKKSLYFIFILQILQKNNKNVKMFVNPRGCVYIYTYISYSLY